MYFYLVNFSCQNTIFIFILQYTIFIFIILYYNKIIIIKLRKKLKKTYAYHIHKKYAHECFFVYLFLSSKFFMSKYNIYILKKCQWELWDKNGKNCRKVKKREKYWGLGKACDYFSSFGSGVGLKNTIKKGLEGKTRPKWCHFGLFFF